MNCRYQTRLKLFVVLGSWLAAGSFLYSQISEPAKPRSPEFAAHLEQATNALKKLAANLPGSVPVPSTWEGSIKYYQETFSSLNRVMEYGRNTGAPDNVPPTGNQSYRAFYYERNGRLRFIVGHRPGVEPYVCDQIFYREQEPIARVSYSASAWDVIDYVHYENDLPVISCRLLKDGEIVLVEEIKPINKAQNGEK